MKAILSDNSQPRSIDRSFDQTAEHNHTRGVKCPTCGATPLINGLYTLEENPPKEQTTCIHEECSICDLSREKLAAISISGRTTRISRRQKAPTADPTCETCGKNLAGRRIFSDGKGGPFCSPLCAFEPNRRTATAPLLDENEMLEMVENLQRPTPAVVENQIITDLRRQLREADKRIDQFERLTASLAGHIDVLRPQLDALKESIAEVRLAA